MKRIHESRARTSLASSPHCGRARAELHKAAAKLGVSQSALSHAMRQFEERLGIRLLMRAARSVSTTEAGQHPLQDIGAQFEEIETATHAPGAAEDAAGTDEPSLPSSSAPISDMRRCSWRTMQVEWVAAGMMFPSYRVWIARAAGQAVQAHAHSTRAPNVKAISCPPWS
jgi:hypothetical protein